MPRHFAPTILALLVCGLANTPLPAFAKPSADTGNVPAASTTAPRASARSREPDSAQMEKDLQRLPWTKFRAIIESVPKLKADVDAYGPLGWQYVQANYARYGWRKNIDKLDAVQKKQLAGLIQKAKNSR